MKLVRDVLLNAINHVQTLVLLHAGHREFLKLLQHFQDMEQFLEVFIESKAESIFSQA